MSVMVCPPGASPTGSAGAAVARRRAHRGAVLSSRLPAPGVCWVMAPLGRYVADAGVRRTGSRAAMPATASPCAPAPLPLAALDGEAVGPVRPDGSRQAVRLTSAEPTRAGRPPRAPGRARSRVPADARTEDGVASPASCRSVTELASRSARGAPSLDAAAAAAAPPRLFCAPGFGPGPFIAGRSPGRVRKHISARPQPTRPVHPLSPPGPSRRVGRDTGRGAAVPVASAPCTPLRRPDASGSPTSSRSPPAARGRCLRPADSKRRNRAREPARPLPFIHVQREEAWVLAPRERPPVCMLHVATRMRPGPSERGQ